ncbi:MAG: TonB family protein [Pyrinomonadaceae bacterium]
MQQIRVFALSPLLMLIVVASSVSLRAQTVGEWETLRPAGEEFEILMPKNSTTESSKEPYHKMTLNTRLYLWSNPTGPVFAVVSMSGIKANPAMYTEVERVNSYVDAFKRWFPKKVRSKELVAKLTFVKEKTLSGHSGREYRIAIADLSGVAHVFATKKRFYVIAALNTQKDDALSDRFLSSFVLPDKIIEAPPTVAAQQQPEEKLKEDPANPQGQKTEVKADAKPAGEEGSAAPSTEVKPESTPPVEPGKRAPISGGVLNGKALSLPQPEYPPIARQAKASGTVVVQVTIDEYGNVIATRAVSGHPLLQAASVAAAMQAKFSPTFMLGEAVKVTGVITYNFVAQ